MRAVQVSRCCPWAARAVRSPRGVFHGLVRRARLSGSIHFIKELNNHSRYCFSWHAVQGRMAADWRMVRVFRGYRGKPFAVHATPWCGAASTISALAEITGLQAGPGLGRSRGRAQPPGKPRTWRAARHSGSRRVTTPVWSGQGDFLLYGAIVRPVPSTGRTAVAAGGALSVPGQGGAWCLGLRGIVPIYPLRIDDGLRRSPC